MIMKIQLDYDSKTITVESKVQIKELFTKLKQALPDWKNWSLDTNTEIIWKDTIRQPVPSPIIIPWWERPGVWYNTGTINYQHYEKQTIDKKEPVSGVYQIEI